MTRLGGASALVWLVACGEKAAPGPLASGAPASLPASAASAPSAPRASGPIAACEVTTPDERVCYELFDEELAAERKPSCTPSAAPARECPAKDRMGACRLPDGSVRYGYPPKTTSQLERLCKESQGKFSATGAPAPDPALVVSCAGKQGGSCEEETVFVAARAGQIEADCTASGGKFTKGEGCPRGNAVATCDLFGKRTIVYYPAEATDERVAYGEDQRTCVDRRGRFAPTAQASAAPSALPDDRVPQNTAREVD